MHYAAEFLRARSFPIDEVKITVSAEKGGPPARLAEIGIHVEVPELNDRLRAGLMKAIDACLLHRTLLDPPKVTLQLHELAHASQ